MAVVGHSQVAPRQRAEDWRRNSHRAAALFGVVAIVAYVATRLLGITHYALNGGESFMLQGVRMSWSDMLNYIVWDMVHPPLSYVLLKLWIAVGGESLLWLKLFPVLASIATLGPFVLLCNELRLRPQEINVALAFAASNAFLIHYAQEVRMYSLFLLFAVCSAWLFMRYVNAGNDCLRAVIPLFVANLALVSTHYFGWLLVLSQLLFVAVCVQRLVRSLGASIVVLGLCFVPWFWLVAQEAVTRGSTIDWIPRPRPQQIAEYFADLNGPLVRVGSIKPGLVLFIVPVLAWGMRVILNRAPVLAGERQIFWFLALVSFGPVAGVFAASWILPDAFWFDRYFIFMSIPYMLLVALAVWRVDGPVLSNAFAVALVSWAVLAGVDDIRTRRFATSEIGSRVEWSRLAEGLARTEELASERQLVDVYTMPVKWKGRWTGDWALQTSLAFYLSELGRTGFRFIYMRDLDALLASAPAESFWIASFERRGNRSSARWREVLMQAGYDPGPELRTGAGQNQVLLIRVDVRASGEQARAGVEMPVSRAQS